MLRSIEQAADRRPGGGRRGHGEEYGERGTSSSTDSRWNLYRTGRRNPGRGGYALHVSTLSGDGGHGGGMPGLGNGCHIGRLQCVASECVCTLPSVEPENLKMDFREAEMTRVSIGTHDNPVTRSHLGFGSSPDGDDGRSPIVALLGMRPTCALWPLGTHRSRRQRRRRRRR